MMAQWDTYRKRATGLLGILLLAMNRRPGDVDLSRRPRNVKAIPTRTTRERSWNCSPLGVGTTRKRIFRKPRAPSAAGDWTAISLSNAPTCTTNGPKTFLGKTGNFDGQDIVKIVLEQPACGRFMSRKLYRFFVRDEVTPGDGKKLPRSFAPTSYNVGTLQKRFSCRAISTARRRWIRNQRVRCSWRSSTYQETGLTEIPTAPNFEQTTEALGQKICAPPNVAGWKGRTNLDQIPPP